MSVFDEILDEIQTAREHETTPTTYCWYLTDTLGSQLYDETTPTFRHSDANDFHIFECDRLLFETDYGSMPIIVSNERIAENTYGGTETVRTFDGDAVLVKTEHGWDTDNEV